MLASHHKIASGLQPLVREHPIHRQVASNEVYLAPYDANQFYYVQYSDRGDKFDVKNDPSVTMYNNYFGSGMNAIVFQEMREARGLAYSARASLVAPSYPNDDYYFFAYIASQNDKLKDAVVEFDRIINDMPQSEEAFQVAKSAILSQLRTRRVTGMGVLNQYMSLRELGLSESRDKAVFEAVQNMTLADVKAFQENWIKGREYLYGFLGRESDFDTAIGYIGQNVFQTSAEHFTVHITGEHEGRRFNNEINRLVMEFITELKAGKLTLHDIKENLKEINKTKDAYTE